MTTPSKPNQLSVSEALTSLIENIRQRNESHCIVCMADNGIHFSDCHIPAAIEALKQSEQHFGCSKCGYSFHQAPKDFHWSRGPECPACKRHNRGVYHCNILTIPDPRDALELENETDPRIETACIKYYGKWCWDHFSEESKEGARNSMSRHLVAADAADLSGKIKRIARPRRMSPKYGNALTVYWDAAMPPEDTP